METAPAAPKRHWNLAPILLAVIITGGYFASLVFVLTQPVPKESERIIDMMLGTLTTVWIMSVSYFFGTTAGSAKKTELIAKGGPVDIHS
jgi:hypothetical protein